MLHDAEKVDGAPGHGQSTNEACPEAVDGGKMQKNFATLIFGPRTRVGEAKIRSHHNGWTERSSVFPEKTEMAHLWIAGDGTQIAGTVLN